MSSDVLFRPFKLKGLNLPNRVVMAPMTRSFSPGGIPTEDVARYYRRRAQGAVGFIISEGTGVDRPAPRWAGSGLGSPRRPVGSGRARDIEASPRGRRARDHDRACPSRTVHFAAGLYWLESRGPYLTRGN